jgi:hypothetical protein
MHYDNEITYGEKRALAEIQSIVNSQWRNGMLPQIRFVEGQGNYSPDEEEWGVTSDISGCDQATSGITQPPILGYALYKIFERSTNNSNVLLKLETYYDHVKMYHDFLFKERDPENECLVSVIHPWETGTDNSPYLDEPVDRALKFLGNIYKQRIRKRKDLHTVAAKFRPVEKHYDCYGRLIDFFIRHRFDQTQIIEKKVFAVQDVLFNSILAASVKSLSILAEKFAQKFSRKPILDEKKREKYEKESKENREKYEKIRSAIQSKLFNEKKGLYYSYDMAAHKLLEVDTIHCLSPMFGKCVSEHQANELQRHLDNENEFMTEVVIPTVSVLMSNVNKFEPLRYWRGPVWPVTNWIIYEGLKNYNGRKAKDLSDSTLRTIEEGRDIDRKAALKWAADLMKFNSYHDLHTTPSKTQYYHGWFWDSCLAAIGWVYVQNEPGQKDLLGKNSDEDQFWIELNKRKKKLDLQRNNRSPAEVYIDVSKKFNRILFSEYYAPLKVKGYKAGAPIGAPLMTWTAALYLDLQLQKVE